MQPEVVDRPYASPDSFAESVAAVLEEVDGLSSDESGELCFGAHGSILVESKRICWARAATMTRRLTDTLRKQRNPPLGHRDIARVVESCRGSGDRIGEALVKSGLVTAAGLRAALYFNAVDAILELSRAEARLSDFVPHGGGRHDPEYVFSTGEILSAALGRSDPALQVLLRGHLARVLGPTVSGLAAVRASRVAPALPIAAQEPLPLGVRRLLELSIIGAECVEGAEREGEPVIERWQGRILVTWRVHEAACVAVLDEGDDEDAIRARLRGDALFERHEP
jgi:hypothetical protein